MTNVTTRRLYKRTHQTATVSILGQYDIHIRYRCATASAYNQYIFLYKVCTKINSELLKRCILHLSTLIFFMVLKPVATQYTCIPYVFIQTGILNNEILRVVQQRPKHTHTTHLCKFYDTLPLPLLHNYQILLLLHKFVNHPNKLLPIFGFILHKTNQFIIMIL